jgi:thioredoxin 1
MSEVKNFKNKINSSRACIVFFTAGWCGPCKSLYPVFDDLKGHCKKEHNGKIEFIKVNVEDDGDIADYYKVKSLPTFFFFANGKLIDSFDGANKDKLIKGYNHLVDLVTR